MEGKPIHVKPSFYAFLFEQLKGIAKEYGYNLMLHGSLNRDLDLVAVQWIEHINDNAGFLMIKDFDKFINGVYSDQKEHYLYSVLPGNRKNYIININRGERNPPKYEDKQYYLDISIVDNN